MRYAKNALGDLVPAVVYIEPNPVLAAVAYQNSLQSAALAGLGCACDGDSGGSGSGYQEIDWRTAMSDDNGASQGRDVMFRNAGINGMGDFVPASFPVPQNPLVNNALVRSLAGLNGIDLTSPTAFMTSVQTGSSFGVSNLMLVGAAAIAAFFLMGGKGRR